MKHLPPLVKMVEISIICVGGGDVAPFSQNLHLSIHIYVKFHAEQEYGIRFALSQIFSLLPAILNFYGIFHIY